MGIRVFLTYNYHELAVNYPRIDFKSFKFFHHASFCLLMLYVLLKNICRISRVI